MVGSTSSPVLVLELTALAVLALWVVAGALSNPTVLALVCSVAVVPLLFVVLPPLVTRAAGRTERIRLPPRRRRRG
jgi:hypothetical protein